MLKDLAGALKSLAGLLAGAVLTLLPARYRRRFLESDVDLHRGAFLGAVVQLILCLGFFIYGYLHFLQQHIGDLATTLIKHGAEEAMGSEAIQYGAGFLTLGEYLIHPTTWLLAYFVLEGLLRSFAAAITGEVVPSLPLALVGWVHTRIDARRAERALGPRVVDEVEPRTAYSPWDLRIRSCRPKPWTALTTISYEDQLYELASIEAADPPRRFVYLLRRKPEGKVIRGLHHYTPDEPLQKEE
ncbi:MAG TPA: hypothetical protein VE825_10295 [Terriglobales bacterium]|jgi:hypothetical protein|nr:hypothetical protein [Terriglobales bacterium]